MSARLDIIGLKALAKSRINVPSRSVKRDTNVSITETVSRFPMILVKTVTIMLNVLKWGIHQQNNAFVRNVFKSLKIDVKTFIF